MGCVLLTEVLAVVWDKFNSKKIFPELDWFWELEWLILTLILTLEWLICKQISEEKE